MYKTAKDGDKCTVIYFFSAISASMEIIQTSCHIIHYSYQN